LIYCTALAIAYVVFATSLIGALLQLFSGRSYLGPKFATADDKKILHGTSALLINITLLITLTWLGMALHLQVKYLLEAAPFAGAIAFLAWIHLAG
jgi:hypothetical protein